MLNYVNGFTEPRGQKEGRKYFITKNLSSKCTKLIKFKKNGEQSHLKMSEDDVSQEQVLVDEVVKEVI